MPSNHEKWGLDLAFVTFETSDDLVPLVTTIPPSMESISLTPRRACLYTSLANSLFYSSIWAVLSMDNLLKASKTTLALPGW